MASVADLLEKANALRAQSNEQRQAREDYAAFVAYMRDEAGWSDEELADYKAKAGVIMGKDDAAVLALFPDGLYLKAEDARMATRNFWRTWREDMRV